MNVNTYQCLKCKKVLKSEVNRNRHTVRLHGEYQVKFRCHICKKLYARKDTLKRHSLTVHESPESRFEQVKIEQPKMEAPKQWYPPPEAMTRPLFLLVYGKDKLLDPTTTSKKRPTTSIREVRDTDPNFKPMTIDEALAALNQPTICTTEELAEDLYITPSNSDTSTSSDKTDCLDELLDWEKEVRNIKVYGTFQ